MIRVELDYKNGKITHIDENGKKTTLTLPSKANVKAIEAILKTKKLKVK